MHKKLVRVCVCSTCVMSGAIDIISAVESLKKLKHQGLPSVKIETFSRPAGENHALSAPVVILENEVLENATTQTVMANILNLPRTQEGIASSHLKKDSETKEGK